MMKTRLPTSGAPPETRLRHDCGVRTDHTVVSDLDQVVDLHAALDAGGAQPRAIDGRVRADLHVVLDHHVPELWHLLVLAAFVELVAEPVTTDRHARLEDHSISDRAPLAYHHAGMEDTVGPDAHVVTDRHVRMQYGVRTDLGPRTHRHLGADRGLGIHLRAGIDECAGMHPRLGTRRRNDQGGRPCEVQVRHRGSDHRTPAHLQVRRGDQRSDPRLLERSGEPAERKKPRSAGPPSSRLPTP